MAPSIIIADDHPLILKGLKEFLIEKGYAIEASAADGKTALKFIETLKPDIAILDIQMPHYTGVEIAEICKVKNYKTKIIIITFEKDENLFKQAKNLNIYGYVLKEFALNEIEQCIEAVLKNQSYFSPDLLRHLKSIPSLKSLEQLTKTERKVLSLIAKNKTGVEIGELFSISTRTVEKHKSNMIKKLGLNRKQNSLLIWAKEHEEFL
ncbi:response regulator transcription factor [Ichthyenterobacterium sp. W332]|uniref:Response regulator transcription factor n=1 Tax=Microcosmobacter mediterraneus TaxID=3075607 RepID=A0ABU2YIC7_9FLAO|nr:response regulator transcription factor [Ichthyenterobacterium sp. W332]MDT0557787.1 response regulator transcription factor [Ichthyenterobacterium sp. W332]